MLLTWEPPSIGHFALATIVKQVGSVSEVVVFFLLFGEGQQGQGQDQRPGPGPAKGQGRAGSVGRGKQGWGQQRGRAG